MIDSLMYLSNLEAVGVPRKQAEAQVRNMLDVINKNLATREDVSLTKLGLQTDFARLRAEFGELKGEFAELKGEFAELKGEFAELKSEFAELKSEFAKLAAKVELIEGRLFLKLVTSMAALLAIQSAISKFL